MELKEYTDWEIENEYDNRGLSSIQNLKEFEDYQIKDEYISRNLDDESTELNDIIDSINQDKPVLDKIRNLLEKSTGRLITKQIK
jgi:hypothetical protein